MDVLVVGCGILGKRHINTLLNIKTIENILIYTKVKDCLEEFTKKKVLKVVSDISDINVDFAIIANETHKHLETAIILAEQGINLFIEKPLSHNLKKVDVLKKIVEEKKVHVFVAYNMRFLGAMRYIKEQISQKVLGNLYFSKIEVGQYLPFWRTGRDYRESYSAHYEKGGGVALDLSHEVDYMRFLFGDPYYWKTIQTKVSDLEINACDLFEGIYQYKSGFVCNVHADYLQRDEIRNIRLVGRDRTLICNFINKSIMISNSDKKHKNSIPIYINDEKIFDIKQTYHDELVHFAECVTQGIEAVITLDDGIQALKLLEDGERYKYCK